MRFFYLIFKYLTSIVKPCVFKLFSLRKITKSNFHHHLPTLNIANLFMQSFASPFPSPSPSPTPPKNHAPQLTPPPKKGATITYTYALSTTKTIERAQLSLIPTPFLPQKPQKRAQLSLIPTPFPPKKPQKGRNYRSYQRPFHPKINRKGATIACFGEKYYYLCKKQINHNYYDKQRINRKSL